MEPGETTWVALIRAIGAGTHAKMPMAALRSAAGAAGLIAPRTLLATGNLIFRSGAQEAELAATLDRIVAAQGLGPAQSVFLRRARDLPGIAAANPFPEAARFRPGHLLVHVLAAPPTPAAAAALAGWPGPEVGQVVGREVFLDFAEGVGTSKLTPARLERLLGQAGTARNWNTLGKLIAATG